MRPTDAKQYQIPVFTDGYVSGSYSGSLKAPGYYVKKSFRLLRLSHLKEVSFIRNIILLNIFVEKAPTITFFINFATDTSAKE